MAPCTSPRRSPRKATSLSIAPKARHCNRCPDKPLLRECSIHSAKAKKAARSSNQAPTPIFMSENQPATNTSKDNRDSTDFVLDPRLVEEDRLRDAARQASASEDLLRNAARQSSPEGAAEGQIQNHIPSQLFPPSSPLHDPTSDQTLINFEGDPVHGTPLRFVNSNPSGLSTPSRASSVTVASQSQKKKRIRVSGKTQPFGRVKGAMRGELEWNIPRRREREQYESSRELRTKCFNVRIERIVQRCEEVARATGCWLYFSAQHRFSDHGFVHYASDRLLSDGGDLINEVHTLHSNMYDALQKATIRDVAQAEMDAARAREGEQAALKDVAALQDTVANKDVVIEKLRAVVLANGLDLDSLSDM
ncbi:hypothetical protein VNI00_017740 [Paramarasmius palmivorus]|uniref:Uncharacterized protein n=1 Tax=Paramarasmius palmivorus TaxID=297713 RepID=A0AAW0B2K8_9AGAR